MKQLKFRALYHSQENGEGMYFSDDYSCLSDFFLAIVNGDLDEESLSQFTGLTDKNKKEIYNGDIVYVAGIGNMEVVFENGCFILKKQKIMQRFDEDFEDDIESIIGNIYENKELLGAEK